MRFRTPQTHYTCQTPDCTNRCSRKHKVSPLPIATVNTCYLSLLYTHALYYHLTSFVCEKCNRDDDDYHYYQCRKCQHVYCHDCCFK